MINSFRRQVALRERAVLLGPGVIFAGLLLILPLGIVTVSTFLTPSLFGGAQTPFTLQSVSRLTEPLYRDVIFTTLWLAGLATLIALILGYPAAYAITRLPRRWRNFAIIAVVLPFWTNFLIRTYAWIVLLNNQGLVNKVLSSIGLTDAPITLMNNKPAIVLGLVYAYLPLMILPLYAAIERIDHELIEAATNLGATGPTRFRTVVLPLTVHGVITGCLFVFIPSLGNFIIPELLGGGKTATLGTMVRDQFLKSRDWPFGSALSLLILVFVAVIVVIQTRMSRRFGTRS